MCESLCGLYQSTTKVTPVTCNHLLENRSCDKIVALRVAKHPSQPMYRNFQNAVAEYSSSRVRAWCHCWSLRVFGVNTTICPVAVTSRML